MIRGQTFAEFERAIIRERVIAGMEKAKAKGARIGRPKILPFAIENTFAKKIVNLNIIFCLTIISESLIIHVTI